MSDLLSLSKYATHRGCSLQAVQDALASGRIVAEMKGGRRFIDPVKCDAEWAANTNHNQRHNSREGQFANYNGGQGNSSGITVPAFQESRAIREAYQARITKLEYEQKKGILIERDAVKANSANTAKIVKDNLRLIPGKLSAELASETDPHTIEQKLMGAIDEVLLELSRYADRF